MYLDARLQTLQNGRSGLRQFGGLNETYGCSAAEYAAGCNFSSRDWPALSCRLARLRLWEVEGINGLYHLNGTLTIHGTTLEYKPDDAAGNTVIIAEELEDSKKQLAGMGTSVLIWPDKKIFNTADGTLESIEAGWSATGVRFELCDEDGTTYEIPQAGTSLPKDTEDSPLSDGQLYLQAKNEANLYAGSSSLQQYSVSLESWSEVSLDYCKISCEGIGANFAQWDTATLAGVAETIKANLGADLDEDKIIYVQDADSIVVSISGWEKATHHWAVYVQNYASVQRTTPDGVTETVNSETQQAVSLARTAPEMEYLCECDNRVWGCASGENVIYACKLGDPKNWYSYRGIASDSYAVTVGSDGAFTGAASCMGYALFFKENALHKLYGSKPSDYQVTSLRCRGVAKGAAGSLTVINETLYYLSAEGVMAWGGGLPEKVSAALARDTTATAARAVGGQLDGRYYLHIETAEGSRRLLVYDTERGLWHEESPMGQEMCSTGRQLYLWDGTAIWAADPTREAGAAEAGAAEGMEGDFGFEWVSGDIGLDTPDDKYISRVTLRLDAEQTSRVKVAASYDGGRWEELGGAKAAERRLRLDLPLAPRRYDTLRLRISGRGRVVLRSVAFTQAAARGNMIQNTL